jgi:hypothetical protein
MNFPLAKVRKYAVSISREIGPYCTQVAVSGMARLGWPTMARLVMVVLPRDEDGLRARIARNAWVHESAPAVLSAQLKMGFAIDFHFARPGRADLFAPTPSNFDQLICLTTGTFEFRQRLIFELGRNGYTLDPQTGLYARGGDVPETEAALLAAAGLQWIEPEGRTAWPHKEAA